MMMAFLQCANVVADHTQACCSLAAKGSIHVALPLEPAYASILLLTQWKLVDFGGYFM